ncbi:MAG: dTDP-4-dehydrorhamnose reductase [Muribaculaceae bacterium]|nr:dTDP-4-dehydrorhamnose reductase [Muribaculaceae bacterium]
MNILVTGANGQLGSSIRSVVNNSADNYIFTDIDQLDITNQQDIERFVDENNVDLIINCAGYTNVESAETDYSKAEMLNATAVGFLASSMKRRNGFLIHISTDYVFGSSSDNTPRGENDPKNAIGAYAVTKWHGELQILDSGVNHIIIRTAWLYSEYGHNFVKTMIRLTKQKPELKVVFDQVGTPTYAHDLAQAIVKIIDNRQLHSFQGVYHYTNEGVCSWYDLAKLTASYCGQTECRINPCHTAEFPSKVSRPAYSVLDKTKFKNTFDQTIPYWMDSLRECITNLTNNNMQ